MNEFLAQFHFLRPLWLLTLPPAVLLAILLWLRKGSAANWRSAIAPELIDYLLESTQQVRPQWPWLLLAGWLLGVIALAGPSWEKLPQPVLQKRDGLVIVLDLSLSMYAEDIKPTRLERARFKVIDILQQRREGLTGLVVYSGDAHVVSPLTDDTATIENLVPALDPAIMPSYGSDAVAGIDTALQLLRNSGFEHGRILLLSDEIAASDIDKIAARIDGKHWQLSLIGVGTEQGAPITLPGDARMGGFMRQSDGSIAIAKLHRDRFTQLAAKVGGRYDDMRVDDSDIARVLPPIATADDNVRTLEREFDQWRERGPQLVMLLLPLAAFAFRRGWLLMLFLLPFSTPSQAWEWRDLWLRPDQQALQEFNQGNSKAAAEKFRDPNWRAASQYRSGDFNGAADSLQAIETADAQYNRGNALAQAGKLEEAIAAYDAALKKNSALADAKANRALVEKMLKQQQRNQPDSTAQKNQNSEQQPNREQQNRQPQPDQAQQNQTQTSGENSQHAQQNRSGQQSVPSAQQHEQQARDQHAELAEQQSAQQAQPSGSGDKNSAEATQRTTTATSPNQSPQQAAARAPEAMTPEQRQQERATEQWLRQIPDDPSGLLRRKFRYENSQREQQSRDDNRPLW